MVLKINEKSLDADYTEKEWDGYKIKTMSSQLKAKSGYSIWNWNDIMFTGLRYLDAGTHGEICMIVPKWIKNPFIGRFIFMGREIVETKAGKFNTVKLGWSMGNMFLAALMHIFYKDYFFWVNEETGILVKETGENNYTAALEEVGV